jgi:hypothetical protein
VLVDQRSGARKILRSKAVVVMDGMSPKQGRTLDLNASGVSITFDHKLAAGDIGMVSFELFVEGKAQIVSCQSRVNYCIFSGDHFKIGFQFLNPDLATMATINKYLR